MSRPVTPLDEADRQALNRIAVLGAAVMVCLRQLGRGKYISENQLRDWLKSDGVQFSSNDLGPGLDLLEATGRIKRAGAKPNTPRAGWLAKGAEIWSKMGSEKPSESSGADQSTNTNEQSNRTEAVEALAVDIIKTLRRRTSRCESEQELLQRLAEDEVHFDLADLPAALARLTTDPEFDGCMLPGYELVKLVRQRPRHEQLQRPWDPPGPHWALVLADVRPW